MSSHGSSEGYHSWHHVTNECKQILQVKVLEGGGETTIFQQGCQGDSYDPPSLHSPAASSLLRSTPSMCWATQEALLQSSDCSVRVVCISQGLQTPIFKNGSASNPEQGIKIRLHRKGSQTQ